MSELERWLEEYHDRGRKERVAKHDMRLRAEAAAQERELAIEHERAVLGVREEYGGRIRILEAENEALKIENKELEKQLSKAKTDGSQGGITTRERNTLLKVVAALLRHSNRGQFDDRNLVPWLSKVIEQRINSEDTPPKIETIRKIISEIRDLDLQQAKAKPN